MRIDLRDPARRSLRLEEWPETDRRAWESALAPVDYFSDEQSPAADWSASTRKNCRFAYGRWLAFLQQAARLDPDAVSGSRATQENVAAYVDFLHSQGLAPQSQAMLLVQLQGVLRAFAPTEDRPWLKRSIRRLQARKVPVRDKIRRLRPAAEILTWALGELDKIQNGPQRLRSPIQYRDALTVALLISCPTMRLSNLASIRIGVHLHQRGGRFELRFEAQEMKGRKAVSLPVPLVLTPYIEHYLETVRGMIAPQADATALWISKAGRPMTHRLLQQQISRTTKRAFGQSINPHLFRDCAASHVAAEDPEAIATAAHVLGHSSLETTEAHYIHRQALAASSRYHESLREVRNKLKPASGRGISA